MPTRKEPILRAAARLGRPPAELLAALREMGETSYKSDSDLISADLVEAVAKLKPWLLLWPTTVLFARHADYDGGAADPPLNALGLARAQDLARVACRAGVAAVFATNTQRAQQTAAPLAAAKGLTIQTYADPAALATTLKTTYAGRVSLVIGHSAGANYLGALIDALVGTHVANIVVDGYQNLFVVTRGGAGSGAFNWRCLNLQYGQAPECEA